MKKGLEIVELLKSLVGNRIRIYSIPIVCSLTNLLEFL